MNGTEMIAAERERQIMKEGWTDSHDDEHDDHELGMAAVCYVRASWMPFSTKLQSLWP